MDKNELDINTRFRKRIGISANEVITFEKLDDVLEKTAKAIPFENMCIIANNPHELTKESIIKKIFDRNEGGLCYELNPAFHFFLIENGFKAFLIRGKIYDHLKNGWTTIGRTHVANLIIHNEETYLIDTGFGGNLPLTPVPLNGKTVSSNNGEFRVKKVESEHGDYILELKLKHKDKDWKIGYAFDSKKIVKDLSELKEIQQIIHEHEQSPFNKNPLITKITDRGNITLTNTTFTEWDDGKVQKAEIEKGKFENILKKCFGMNIS